MNGPSEALSRIRSESIGSVLNLLCEPIQGAPKSIVTADHVIEMAVNSFGSVRRRQCLFDLLKNGNLFALGAIPGHRNCPNLSIMINNFEARLGKLVSSTTKPQIGSRTSGSHKVALY
jgi:hypothetical protein